MNHDDNSPDRIDPELEARVVAWVLGEAPPAEAAELAQIVAKNPELAVFKRRIEAVHGLVGEAAQPAPAAARLSPGRRARLLAAIAPAQAGQDRSRESASEPVLRSVASRKKHQPWRQWLLPAAACIALGLLGSAIMIPAFRKARWQDPGEPPSASRQRGQAVFDQTEIAQDRVVPSAAPAFSEGFKLPPGKSASTAPNAAGFGGGGFGAGNPITINVPDASARGADNLKFSGPGGGGRENAGDARQYPLNFTQGYPVVVSGIAGARTLTYMDGSGGAGQALAGKAKALLANNDKNGDGKLDPGEIAAMQAGQAKAAWTAAAPEPNKSNDVVTLNPFEVDASKDIGYYAENTLAGSRLNTNVGDLASSITVVTKQQLDDTSALNINDVFLYEANTEGTPFAAVGGIAPNGLGGRPGAALTQQSLPAAARSDAKKTPVLDDAPVVHAAGNVAIDESLRAEVATRAQAISTFSLHVSDVSFRLARAALARGERPDPASIRPEEFYNAFDYGDPSPAPGEPVSCRIEQAAHPFLQQRTLVRIAMKIPATGRGAGQPLRLTVLLDTSGSMERDDRVATVRRAMTVLASLLGPADRITLIGFARQPRLLADRVPGDQAARLVDLISHTPAEGGTNLEEALELAGQHARAQFTAGAQNRIVVLTDGAANLGNDNPAQLAALVEALRQQGIAFDACGVGVDGLDDSVLEALTRKGDGRYAVINSPDEADAGFAHRLAGAFRPAAQNVKVQVRFNPARVRSYRLIGFERQRLGEADFRNDQVAAAALAAEEAAVAVYQVEVLPEGDGELGDVFVRFRNATTGEMVERSWTLAYAAQAAAFDRATPSMQLAGTAALLAEKLRGGAPAAPIRLETLAPVVDALHTHYAHDARVQELTAMFAQARRVIGE